MLPIILGAGIGALTPLVSEIFRTKPDPKVAKDLILTKRQEFIDRALGEGLTQQVAEKRVDAEMQAAMEEADRQGQFNTPWGEMFGMALLGGGVGMAFPKVAQWVSGLKGAKAIAPAAAAAAAPAAETAGAKVASAADDVYKAGFRSPAVDRALSGELDTVGAPKRIGMSERPVAERGFTMSDAASTPFPGKGRGDFNVEIIGDTGGARMVPVDVQAPFPGMARGGERIATSNPLVGLPPPGQMYNLPPDEIGRILRLRQATGD
jgi:hypothetical protein